MNRPDAAPLTARHWPSALGALRGPRQAREEAIGAVTPAPRCAGCARLYQTLLVVDLGHHQLVSNASYASLTNRRKCAPADSGLILTVCPELGASSTCPLPR